MARQRRLPSNQNIYHIVLKGINANVIFTADNDYKYFLKFFKNACTEYDAELLAYCLMDNHIHLLIKFNQDNIAEMFKSFGAKYVPKYNANHSRTGPLFNGRYYSSPINDDRYLLAVLRYIHYNPVKARICRSIEEYRWSSYQEYSEHKNNVCDISFIENMFTQAELEMLHIIDDSVLDETFVINSRINGTDENEIEQFITRNKERNVDEMIEIFKRAKLSKKSIASHLNIDRRSL